MTEHKEQLDNLQKNLDTVIGWIKSADTKSGIALALNGGLAVFVIDFGKKLFTNSNGCIPSFFYVASVILFLLSTYFAFRVLLPNVKAKAKYHLWFFGSISQMKKEEFEEQICNISKEDMCKNIAEQIHINSCIASKKHSYLSNSWKMLAFSALFAMLTFFFWIL